MEIVGISGEGSVTIKSFRKAVTDLFIPLTKILVKGCQEKTIAATNAGSAIPDSAINLPIAILQDMSEDEKLLFNVLSHVYSNPELSTEYGDIYQFCKSLELCEAALLSGFYHKHYTLACCVIGTNAKGTLASGVSVLKQSLTNGCFPMLDRIRYTIAAPFDEKYKHNRGKIINQYCQQRGIPPVK